MTEPLDRDALAFLQKTVHRGKRNTRSLGDDDAAQLLAPDGLSYTYADLTTSPPPQAPVSPNGLAIFTASTIEPRSVDWIWPSWLPAGRLTMLQGDPGNGKSWLTLAIATAMSRAAPLPEDERPQTAKRSMVLSAEDDLHDTIRPRLDLLGADLEMIDLVRAKRTAKGQEAPLSLIDDLPAVEHYLEQRRYGLIVVDPINAYLGATLDTHRDAAVRSVLAPLSALAERFGASVLCVSHLTKGGRDRSIYRGQGSIAYVAAARVVLLLGKDPDEEQKRHLVCIKNNLAQSPAPLAFVLSDGLQWAGRSDFTAETLLAPDDSEAKGALAEAQEIILQLIDGQITEARAIMQHATKAGYSQKTLERARTELKRTGKIIITREGFGDKGRWLWDTPREAPNRDV